jgi:hypothetical protein
MAEHRHGQLQPSRPLIVAAVRALAWRRRIGDQVRCRSSIYHERPLAVGEAGALMRTFSGFDLRLDPSATLEGDAVDRCRAVRPFVFRLMRAPASGAWAPPDQRSSACSRGQQAITFTRPG